MGIARRACYARPACNGKAGWVAGRFDFDGTFPPFGGFETASATLSGLLIGLGLEYALGGNWTVKFEYDYLSYLSKDVTFTACIVGACAPYFEAVSADKHIFKFGINYLFGGGPVVARY